MRIPPVANYGQASTCWSAFSDRRVDATAIESIDLAADPSVTLKEEVVCSTFVVLVVIDAFLRRLLLHAKSMHKRFRRVYPRPYSRILFDLFYRANGLESDAGKNECDRVLLLPIQVRE